SIQFLPFSNCRREASNSHLNLLPLFFLLSASRAGIRIHLLCPDVNTLNKFCRRFVNPSLSSLNNWIASVEQPREFFVHRTDGIAFPVVLPACMGVDIYVVRMVFIF